MRRRVITTTIADALIAALAMVAVGASAIADDAPRVNAEGIFNDQARWMYESGDQKFYNGDPVNGTNENLMMPSPSPKLGERLVGLTHLHHSMQTFGYPLHVSLVDKLFANHYNISVYSVDEGDLWKYEPGTNLAKETMIEGKGRSAFSAAGPVAGDAPIPEKYQAAFAFLRQALNSVTNLPGDQRNLKNYHILFVETNDVIWMELGPSFASDEAPHLGCQTKLGRNMVFAFEKDSHVPGRTGGPFLQCF